MNERYLISSIACAGMLMCSFAVGSAADGGKEEPKIKGKPVSTWITQLKGSNRGLQVRAARALSEATSEQIPAIVPKLVPILESDRANDRFVAAQTLGNYGPPARAAVPLLVPLLRGTQFERNRAAGAKALGLILKDAKHDEEVEKVTLALTAKFNEDYDQYSDVRRESVRALGMIGPAAKSCIPKLTRALTDYVQYSREHQMVRQQAAWTCGRMGPLAREHMDRLISMMHQEAHEVPEIVEAIGCIGLVHDNVLSNIIDKFEKTGEGTNWGGFKIAALKALARFGDKSVPAVLMLKRTLARLGADRTSFAIRTELMKTLAAIGPKAKAMLPEIEAAVKFNNYGDWRIPQEEKDKLHKELREEAAKAYKAVSGKEPPVEKK